MLTVYSEAHRKHHPKHELAGGEFVRPFEMPRRMDMILDRLGQAGMDQIVSPEDHGMTPLRRIHDNAFLEFLEGCWDEWETEGFAGEAIASVWPARRMQQRPPDHIDGKLGYYALAAETAICSGTWEAARSSANVALTARQAIADGLNCAFALCRPPGHHAAADLFGGYCFLNNAAIAAQAFLDDGASRVAVLDVDFHHGNGTQDIFYGRDDVLFLSLHGDPRQAFPNFLGYEDEAGAGKGEGFNGNYPLPPGTDYECWGQALASACQRIQQFGPDAIVISLGVDTFKEDPISFFKLDSDDFRHYGNLLAGLNRPTLFVMEGGYAVEAIGVNTVNVLQGFLDR
ncbi:MAG: histone deacetylase family protein [Pseudomonadota bacterium]